ncbi:Signal peptide protein [Desulfosarcina cetonica]|uniref:DUF1254 domain-containing protein n=1 Tax=Desulfosarcina cetonica TaxID=90730 RepID=UPI0006D0FA7A|nr:DUF1254 domain-containing protein [Desulfosarcina cetonica]VTR65413.1 Signal peptide protein [Desulfosarcina cetonica]
MHWPLTVRLSIFLILLMFGGEFAEAAALPKMRMATDIPESIIVPDRIDTRIGPLEFFDGFPKAETVRRAYDFLDFQRGVDVFLDEMRAASMVALREGHRQLGIMDSHQVAVFENLMDSKSLWLTANSETVYASTFIDLKKKGPTVIESPPNVLGILDDMWMRYVGDIGNAGPDKGKGGRFVILPPGHDGDVPKGVHVFRSKTYGVWFLLRGFLVDGDTGPAVASIKKQLRIYPLAQADSPPAMEFKNVSGKVHNTIHANDFHFFEELNSLIQEEHAQAIDPEVRGRLALLGIVKGQPFNPDPHMRKILEEAAWVGAAIARSVSFASRDDSIYLYPETDRTWFNPFTIGNHEFMTEDGWLNRDARTQFMYNAIGITPAMAVAMPGIGSQYAAACRDADGEYLDGSKTYKLRLPPHVPAKDFWSIVLYDAQTRSMLQTDQPFPSLNSQSGEVEMNTDGSTDIYFGPEAPAGKENNWVQTVSGKGFWLILRLYGPLEPWFDKTWRPGKIEMLK